MITSHSPSPPGADVTLKPLSLSFIDRSGGFSVSVATDQDGFTSVVDTVTAAGSWETSTLDLSSLASTTSAVEIRLYFHDGSGDRRVIDNVSIEAYLSGTGGTGTGYSSWAASNAGGQAPDLDFDNDGVANGIEFFLNSPAGITSLPTPDASNTITWPNGGNIAATEYGPDGLFVVQTSTDLVSWEDVALEDLTTNSDSELAYSLTGAPRLFVRLKMTLP